MGKAPQSSQAGLGGFTVALGHVAYRLPPKPFPTSLLLLGKTSTSVTVTIRTCRAPLHPTSASPSRQSRYASETAKMLQLMPPYCCALLCWPWCRPKSCGVSHKTVCSHVARVTPLLVPQPTQSPVAPLHHRSGSGRYHSESQCLAPGAAPDPGRLQ